MRPDRNANCVFSNLLSRIILVSALALCMTGCALFETPELSSSTQPEPDPSAPPAAAQAGDVLIVGGGSVVSSNTNETDFTSTAKAELFKQATKSFVATGPLVTSRAGIQAIGFFGTGSLAHTAIVPGGMHGTSIFNAMNGVISLSETNEANSETFNKAGNFTAGATMKVARALYTATVLKNGTVLIAGGFSGETPLNSAEIYNPATKKFTATGPMKAKRALHTATLLANGQVLLAGGIKDASGTTANTAELYNPATGKFTMVAASMTVPLAAHTATLISGCGCAKDGEVLLAGGFTGSGSPSADAVETTLTAAMLYNPSTKTFANAPALHDPRNLHTATLIKKGKVLLTGGVYGQTQFGNNAITAFAGGGIRDTAEIYDPNAGTVTCVGGTAGTACKSSMKVARAAHTATLIPSGTLKGQVLLAGGNTNGTGELFNPATNKFTATGKLHTPRGFYAAVAVQ